MMHIYMINQLQLDVHVILQQETMRPKDNVYHVILVVQHVGAVQTINA
jgi:hypothetical protein